MNSDEIQPVVYPSITKFNLSFLQKEFMPFIIHTNKFIFHVSRSKNGASFVFVIVTFTLFNLLGERGSIFFTGLKNRKYFSLKLCFLLLSFYFHQIHIFEIKCISLKWTLFLNLKQAQNLSSSGSSLTSNFKER